MKRFQFVATFVLALVVFAPRPLASRNIPLTCNWDPTYSGGAGVFGDGVAGGGEYEHGNGGVQCYFGVNARDVDMITYNTPRRLHLVFDVSGQSGLANDLAGLPDTVIAEVDLFGINHWGRYVDMADGSTAQVQMDLEFHDPNSNPPRTFELEYSALVVVREGNTWTISSEAVDDPWDVVRDRTSVAKLNEIRRRGSVPYGEISMPIRFTVTLLEDSPDDGGGPGNGKGPKKNR